jgi:hypothetical protein
LRTLRHSEYHARDERPVRRGRREARKPAPERKVITTGLPRAGGVRLPLADRGCTSVSRLYSSHANVRSCGGTGNVRRVADGLTQSVVGHSGEGGRGEQDAGEQRHSPSHLVPPSVAGGGYTMCAPTLIPACGEATPRVPPRPEKKNVGSASAGRRSVGCWGAQGGAQQLSSPVFLGVMSTFSRRDDTGDREDAPRRPVKIGCSTTARRFRPHPSLWLPPRSP